MFQNFKTSTVKMFHRLKILTLLQLSDRLKIKESKR